MSDIKPEKQSELSKKFTPASAAECPMEDLCGHGFAAGPSPGEHHFRPVRPPERTHDYE